MKNKKEVLTTLMGVLLVVTLIPLIGYAAVPQQITYQGQLTDQYGDPVPDGDYDMTFAIYDVPTGDTALWAEAQTVTVTDGIYNVILGQPGNELDPTDFDGDLYLGVTVGTDTEMTPRQPITSVGYALRAAVADTVPKGAISEIMIEDRAVTTDKVADNAITEQKIGDGTVTTDKVADNAITEQKIGDGTVTTVKIQDGATLLEISDDDGAGSGLDADLIDGYDSSAFMRAGVDKWVNESGDTMTGKLEIGVQSGTTGLSSLIASSASGTRAIYGWAMASSGTTYGVYGESNSTSGIGVYGEAATYGVYGESGANCGVYGRSRGISGSGVHGNATPLWGDTYGVYGESASSTGRGVYGEAPYTGIEGRASATTGTTYGVHGVSDSTSGYGVMGYASASTGTTYGVYGRSDSTSGYGVRGYAAVTTGTTVGVYGRSNSTDGYGGFFSAWNSNGIGIGAYGGPSGYAADFQGNVRIRDYSTGDTVMELGTGLDYAEGFDVSHKKEISPGSVLIIDPDNPGKLTMGGRPYDTKVAGIVAGANGTGSGVRLGAGQFDYDVALAGRVYCNVDATESAVEPGDLLTTSGTPGYAMKATDYGRAQGAILGKAMQKLEKGQKGQILVLVTLQ